MIVIAVTVISFTPVNIVLASDLFLYTNVDLRNLQTFILSVIFTGLNLMDLHDEIIVKIMELLSVSELLRNVSKVYVRFWMIIRQHTSLYMNVTFEDSFHIDEHVLLLLTRSPQKLKVLELGSQMLVSRDLTRLFMGL